MLVFLFQCLRFGYRSYCLGTYRGTPTGYWNLFSSLRLIGPVLSLFLLTGLFTFLWALIPTGLGSLLAAAVSLLCALTGSPWLLENPGVLMVSGVFLGVIGSLFLLARVLRYHLAPYVLLDNPSYTAREALQESEERMRKRRASLVVLWLSTLGHWLLAGLVWLVTHAILAVLLAAALNCSAPAEFPAQVMVASFDGKYVNLIYPEDREAVMSDITEQLKKSDVVTMHYRTRCKNGNLMWLETISRLCPPDPDGIQRACSSVVDISEIIDVQREEKNRGLNIANRYESAAREWGEFLFEYDLVSDILISSENFNKLFGRDARRPFPYALPLVHEQDREKWRMPRGSASGGNGRSPLSYVCICRMERTAGFPSRSVSRKSWEKPRLTFCAG